MIEHATSIMLDICTVGKLVYYLGSASDTEIISK